MQPIELATWKFTPVARTDDPAWQGRPIWSELNVVAATAGAAILAAERHYERSGGFTDQDSQDGQQSNPGFGDVKLYRVDRIASAGGLQDRDGQVLSEIKHH